MGFLFFIVAAILFFMSGIGWQLAPPKAETWGLFCIALGLAFGGWWPTWRR